MSIKVMAELAGTVWRVNVDVGTTVSEGQTLLILESMKMEIPIAAPDDGTVAQVHVAVGDIVATGQILVELDEH